MVRQSVERGREDVEMGREGGDGFGRAFRESARMLRGPGVC